MSELQPAQNNLSAIFLAACGALPAPAAILGSAVPMTGAQRLVSRKLTKSIAAGVVAIAIAGGSYGIVSATSSGSSAAASSGTAGGPGSGGGSNARSGPAAGGSSGTASSVSTSGFTLTTAAGQKVTVHEASATTYEKGTSAASASAVTAGETVLVLGTTSGTTITATQVIVQPS